MLTLEETRIRLDYLTQKDTLSNQMSLRQEKKVNHNISTQDERTFGHVHQHD